MTKGLNRSLNRGNPGGGPEGIPPVIRKTITVSGSTLTVDGASGVGFGTLVLGELPQGNLLLLGAVATFAFTGPTSGSLDDDWAGDYAVGTTPASDGTVTGADADIVQSTALAAATGEASPSTRGTSGGVAIVDNTDGSAEINLNLLVDDANISADDLDFTVVGEVTLTFGVLGDD